MCLSHSCPLKLESIVATGGKSSLSLTEGGSLASPPSANCLGHGYRLLPLPPFFVPNLPHRSITLPEIWSRSEEIKSLQTESFVSSYSKTEFYLPGNLTS